MPSFPILGEKTSRSRGCQFPRNLTPALFVVVVFCFSTDSSLFAITIRHDVPPADYASLATPFPHVGSFRSNVPNGPTFCTGTLIGQDRILTAAHCFDATANQLLDQPLETIVFSTSSISTSFDEGGRESNPMTDSYRFPLASVEFHPDWTSSRGDPRFDLAVVHVNRDARFIINQKGLPLSERDSDRFSIDGQLVTSMMTDQARIGTFVGYGTVGTGESPRSLYDGYLARIQHQKTGIDPRFVQQMPDRMAAQNRIRLDQSGLLKSDFDAPSQLREISDWDGELTALMLEGSTTPGDSGGPLFFSLDDSESPTWVLAGVLAGGYNPSGPPSAYGDVSKWVWLGDEVHRSFLESQGIVVVPEVDGWIWSVGSWGLLLAKRRVRIRKHEMVAR